MLKSTPLSKRTVRANDTSNFEIQNLIATSDIGRSKKYFKKEVRLNEKTMKPNSSGVFQSQKERPLHKIAKDEEN